MKPDTYTQLYIQLIFATKFRKSLLKKESRDEIWKYISGIVTNKGHKSLIVNGVSDHVHIFFGLNPVMSISDIVKEIKRSSSIFINQNIMTSHKFQWQDGYAAFSYSRSQISNVFNYIANQEKHHQIKTFREEYIELLEEFGIDYTEKYFFEFFD